jgi:CRP-like cAMP-binding protein
MEQLDRHAFDAVIDQSPLKSLATALRDRLFTIHRLVRNERNQEVFRSDVTARKLFVIAEGAYRLVLKDGTVKAMQTGELFGEIGALTNSGRMGSVAAGPDGGALVTFSRDALMEHHLIADPEQPDLTTVLFAHVSTYLRASHDNSTEALIKAGEGPRLEFKEGTQNPKVLPALASFLNTEGGTLLIGVNDQGEVIGIPEYSNTTADLYDQDLQNLLRAKFGAEALPSIRFCHTAIDGKGVYRIDCQRAPRPVFLKNGKQGEQLIIRAGATTQQLGMRDALHYIAKYFPNELPR